MTVACDIYTASRNMSLSHDINAAPETDRAQIGSLSPTSGSNQQPWPSRTMAERRHAPIPSQAAGPSAALPPSSTPPAQLPAAAACCAACADNNMDTAVAVCRTLIQHSNGSNGSLIICPHVICKLLATSKALWPLVYQHYSGLLQLALHARSPEQLQQFCCWFKRHARLVRTLDLTLPDIPGPVATRQPWVAKPRDHAAKSGCKPAPINVEAELAAAFVVAGRKAVAVTAAAAAEVAAGVGAMNLGSADQTVQQSSCHWGVVASASAAMTAQQQVSSQTAVAAAAATDVDPGLMHLEAFTCYSDLSLGSTHIILQQLQRCSNLTVLRLHILCDGSTDRTLREHTMIALGQLRSLAVLELIATSGNGDETAFEALLPHLSRFSRLKVLRVPRSNQQGNMECLPVSLEKLSLDAYDVISPVGKPLMLTHLTALTELVLWGASYQAETAAVGSKDQLPESLLVLKAPDCPNAAPLLPLKNLKELILAGSTTQAAETYEISSALTALTNVELGYSVAFEVPPLSAALTAAWASVPIRKLKLFHGIAGMGADMDLLALQRISRLTQLTYLSLQEGRGSYVIEANPQQLAECLYQLTNLQDLILCGVEVQRMPVDHVVEPELIYNPRLALAAQAVGCLSRLTNLDFCVRVWEGYEHVPVPTPLQLERQRADKQAALGHIASITQLQSLRLHTRHLADDASLRQLSSLQQLTVLRFWECDQFPKRFLSKTHVQHSDLHDLMGKLPKLKLVELWVDPGRCREMGRDYTTRIVPTR